MFPTLPAGLDPDSSMSDKVHVMEVFSIKVISTSNLTGFVLYGLSQHRSVKTVYTIKLSQWHEAILTSDSLKAPFKTCSNDLAQDTCSIQALTSNSAFHLATCHRHLNFQFMILINNML